MYHFQIQDSIIEVSNTHHKVLGYLHFRKTGTLETHIFKIEFSKSISKRLLIECKSFLNTDVLTIHDLDKIKLKDYPVKHYSMVLKKSEYSQSLTNKTYNIDQDSNEKLSSVNTFLAKAFILEPTPYNKAWMDDFQKIKLEKGILIQKENTTTASILMYLEKDKNNVYIFLTGTSINHRGEGRFRAFVDYLFVQGYSNISLGVINNTDAYQVYKKMGFEVLKKNCVIL
jgi:hypothetical protein